MDEVNQGICKSTGTCPSEQTVNYIPLLNSFILPGSETWPITEDYVIRLERFDARIVMWMGNMRT